MRSTESEVRLGKITEIPVPQVIADQPGVQVHAYTAESGTHIVVAREPAKRAPAGMWVPPHELLLWHMSISHPERYPTWDEIADARYELTPTDVTMAMILPVPDLYLNLHPYCFHLWQIDDRRAIG